MRAMPDPSELNPYAPPQADPEGPARVVRGARAAAVDLDEARARLIEHLADPARVQDDLAAAGGRLRTVTIVICGIAGLALALTAYAFLAGSSTGAALPIAIMFAFFFSVLAIALLVLDLSLVPRGQTASPDATLRSYLKSIATGRVGYAWATLAPTARERSVSAPLLGEVVTGTGEFSMGRPEGIKEYGSTFARPGGGQMRNMAVKRVVLADSRDDVAIVEAVLAFQSWPRWVSIVMGVGFVLFRPAILVGVVLYFVMRKRHEVRVTKTLLRGRDNAWYVVDADILEGREGR